jgi:predicted NodU family carbamoyl transferase
VIILGVNSGDHDGAAVILRDNEVLAFVENDRVTRVKRGWQRSPATAIRRCLDLAGVSLQDLDAVAVGWDLPAFPEHDGERPADEEHLAYYEWILGEDERPESTRGPGRRRRPAGELPRDLPPIHFVPHHLAHAAASMWTSGFERAAIVIADGRGELSSTSIGYGEGSHLGFERSWGISHSLGHFFNFASEFVGFDFSESGKLMGLAAYGSPVQPMPIRIDWTGYEFVGVGDPADRVDERLEQQRAALDRHFAAANYPYQRGDGHEPLAFANFAASAQAALEEAMLAVSVLACEIAGSDRLVLGGGVGLNCTMVGKLWRSGRFSDIHVPPFTYDAGGSLGAALTVAQRLSPGEWSPLARTHGPFWGCPVDPERGAEDARRAGLHVRRMTQDDLTAEVAHRLAEGHVLGWAQGRAEVGQRALGGRSIIGDPRERLNLVRINELKGREIWRPLAPSIHPDFFRELFAGSPPPAAEFMLAACPVKPAAARRMPACTHVDQSARPQLVSRASTPSYFAVVDKFRELMGVPAIINTSFNLAGEPIVNDGADAVDTFLRCDLDALVLDDYLITKSDADATPAAPVER